jgi:mRNA interferase HicA
LAVNSDQFNRWLRRQGATFEPGKGGHRIVRLNGRTSVVPTHGGRKQLGTGLINKIKKDLGLK